MEDDTRNSLKLDLSGRAAGTAEVEIGAGTAVDTETRSEKAVAAALGSSGARCVSAEDGVAALEVEEDSDKVALRLDTAGSSLELGTC